MQLQENIEQSLSELQQKPRGLLAKYAKLSRFEDEILGPNKDLTNIDTEIKEAEEFLSEEQINIIRSIVTESEKMVDKSDTNGASTSSDASKWNNLKPTLKSLGLVREPSSLIGRIDEENSENEDLDDESDDNDDDDDGK
jgi:hypothetical protein